VETGMNALHFVYFNGLMMLQLHHITCHEISLHRNTYIFGVLKIKYRSETHGSVKDFSDRRLIQEFATGIWKKTRWWKLWKRLWSNALPEAVSVGRLKLQITFPQSQFCDMQCDAAMMSSSY